MISVEEMKSLTGVATSNIGPKTTNRNSSSSSSIDSENSLDSELNDKSSLTKIRFDTDYPSDYQADLSMYYVRKNPSFKADLKYEMPIWKPSVKITNEELEGYLFSAVSKSNYSIEQSLATLYCNDYDILQALKTTRDYVPVPNEWSEEDKIIFEQAYNYHGKNFYKIKQCLPDKSQASLVNFYYMWKKTGRHVSHIQQIEQQNGKSNTNSNNNENGINSNFIDPELNGQNQNIDNENDEGNFVNNVNKICSNCDSISDSISDLQSTPKGVLCNPCYIFYKNTSGLMRPDDTVHINGSLSADQSDIETLNKRNENSKEARNFQKSLRKPPKGIYLNYEELVNLAEHDFNIAFNVIDRRLFSLRKEVQSNKQEISTLITEFGAEEEKNSVIEFINNDPEFLNVNDDLPPTPSWTPHEIILVIQGFNRYGSDFNAISEVIGTKSENSIKSFYQYHKENYNLEKLINNPAELKARSEVIYNDLNSLNRPDLPVKCEETNLSDNFNSSNQITERLLTACENSN